MSDDDARMADQLYQLAETGVQALAQLGARAGARHDHEDERRDLHDRHQRVEPRALLHADDVHPRQRREHRGHHRRAPRRAA